MNPTWKAVAGVIVVFILGCVLGVLATLVVVKHKAMAIQHNPDALAIVLERQTTRNLGLDADKRHQLHALFVQNIRQRLELQRQIQPQIKTANAQTLEQINALLTPEQQQRFHDNLILFKDRSGRNPFNVSADDSAVKASATDAVNAAASGSIPPK